MIGAIVLLARVGSALAAAGGTAAADPSAPSGYFDSHKLAALAARVRELQAGGPWPQLAGPEPLALGSTGDAVATLRTQLARLGDLPPGAAPAEWFDAGLETAVKAFQARHGLAIDGVVGPASRRALNQTPARRLARIGINLERLARLGVEPRHVLVNIPAYELVLIEGGRVLLHSPVVVGRPSRPTPEFADRVVNLVLAPTWTPTPKIAKLDILPKLIADPGYAARERIRVFDGWGPAAAEINPLAVDWSRLAPDHLRYRFRQDSGPANSLGLVRFSLTNDADIYLHDTPHRELFEKPSRAFSSGCVRVAEARALALLALEPNGGWSGERLDSVLASGVKQVVRLAKPLPIHLIYITVWVDERGVAQFRDDIYGLDVPAAPSRAIQ